MSIVEPPETIYVDSDADEVSCDGGVGAFGHPRIYMSFDGRTKVECGYCDRAFIKGKPDENAMSAGEETAA